MELTELRVELVRFVVMASASRMHWQNRDENGVVDEDVDDEDVVP